MLNLTLVFVPLSFQLFIQYFEYFDWDGFPITHVKEIIPEYVDAFF